MKSLSKTISKFNIHSKKSTKLPKRLQQKRFLNLHEYQSHALMRSYDINVPAGKDATSPEEVLKIAEDIGTDVVVKAQVLAGGRGKGVFMNGFEGGVHVTYSNEEAGNVAKQMLGQKLVTKQTGSIGAPCDRVYVQERLYARREMYFAILLDRESGGVVMMGSSRGGVNIEEVARDHPEDIVKVAVDVSKGIPEGAAEEMAKNMGFADRTTALAGKEIENLYRLFMEKDCTLLEINPMIETNDHRVICADAKLNIDDNSEFRQPELFAMRDTSQEDPRDIQASKYDLNYIGLDGDIGCLVNGAGLAMATMDIIKLHGGHPANFLDVGGSASQEQIYQALQIIASDSNVKSILVNIFGGIMRCDVIAKGLIAAVKQANFEIPIILRLDGTKAKEGLQLVKNSGIKTIILSEDLQDSSKRAVLISQMQSVAEELNLSVDFSFKDRHNSHHNEEGDDEL